MVLLQPLGDFLDWLLAARQLAVAALGTVGHGVDQRRTVAGACPGHRLAHDRANPEHVIAVDPDARHAVADAAVGKGVAGGLFLQRRADRELVVLHDEHDRQPAQAREVHRLVDLPAVRGAVAEDHDRDVVALLHLHRPRGAGAVGDVGAEIAGKGAEQAVLEWQRPVATEPAPVVGGGRAEAGSDQLVDRRAAHHRASAPAPVRRDHVTRPGPKLAPTITLSRRPP